MSLHIGVNGTVKTAKMVKVRAAGIVSNCVRADIGIGGISKNWYWYTKNINSFQSCQLFLRKYRLTNLSANKTIYEGTDVKGHLGNGIGGIIVNTTNKTVEVFARYPYAITVMGENYVLTSDGQYLYLGNFSKASNALGFKWPTCDVTRYLGGATLSSAGNFNGSKSLDTNNATFVCNYIGNTIKVNSSLGNQVDIRVGASAVTNDINLTVQPSSSSHSGKSTNHYSYLMASVGINRLYLTTMDQSVEILRDVYLNNKLTNLM